MKMVDSVLYRRHGWRVLSSCLVFSSFLLVVALGLLGGCGDDADDPTFPLPPEPESYNWIYDIYGTDENNIYACGNHGTMFHFDGVSWTKVSSGTSSSIVSFWSPGDGDNTLYACGHGGYIGRNTGSKWSTMASGTTAKLFGLGQFGDDIFACGEGGALRRLSGSSWVGVGGDIVVRDPLSNEPVDTLSLSGDIVSLVVVNQYGIAGAYNREEPATDDEGNVLVGSQAEILLIDDGMILTDDEDLRWELTGMHEDQDSDSEWVVSQVSSTTVVDNNYLGSSQGWLWKLNYSIAEDQFGWNRVWPQVVTEPDKGIKDMWLDPDSNLYLVTDDGQVVFQPQDWDGIGTRPVIFDHGEVMAGIWGVSTDLFWTVGWCETIFEFRRDPDSGELVVTEFPLDYPNKVLGPAPTHDEIGRPLR